MIEFNREELLDLWGVVEAVAPTRSPKEVLTCALLSVAADVVAVRASNLEQFVQAELRPERSDDHPPFLLPIGRLGAIMRANEADTVKITPGQKVHKIAVGRSRYEVGVVDPNLFPSAESPKMDAVAHVPSSHRLADAISATSWACDAASSRYAMGGVQLRAFDDALLLLDGTDGRRLARARVAFDSRTGKQLAAIIPQGACRQWMRLCRRAADGVAIVQWGEQSAMLEIPSAGVRCVTRIVEGRFPRVDDIVLGDSDQIAEHDRAALIAALRAAGVSCSNDARGAVMTWGSEIDGGLLRIEAGSADGGQGVAECEAAVSREHRAKLDVQFLLDWLQSVSGERVELRGKGPDDLVRLSCGADRAYYLMPMAEG